MAAVIRGSRGTACCRRGGWALPGDCTVRGFPAPNVSLDEMAAAAWIGEGPDPYARTAP